MKQVVAILGLAALGAGAWFVASRLSSDALGMIVGLMFGILAGVPAALLVLMANRRRPAEEESPHGRGGYGAYPALPQPPVIVVTGGAPQQLGANGRYGAAGYQVIDYPGVQARAALPGPGQAGGRPFRLVGEQDGWVEE